MTRFVSHGPRATRQCAKNVLATLLRTRRDTVILALVGELGSGKTTFVQGLARALGIRGKIQSPTFVLVRRYRLPKRYRSFWHLIHIDAYRLDSLAEARRIDLKQLFQARNTIVVIEWADRIKRLIPRHATWIRFSHSKKAAERIVSVGG